MDIFVEIDANTASANVRKHDGGEMTLTIHFGNDAHLVVTNLQEMLPRVQVIIIPGGNGIHSFTARPG